MLVQLQALLVTIGIGDILDIAVVAYFLYKLYTMLKNTRAATLLKGILALGICLLLCTWMHLHVISWLLEKSMTIIMVALPVVFQPELRRALEQIGSGRFLLRKGAALDEDEIQDLLNSVAKAVVNLSRRKVGALMVFERGTGLEERIETGVPLDALVSDGLIINIFEKDTPLHDGAIIIRGQRIVAASCILPLTENRNLSQELGTRHRAGIGISEQSDAVVLMVSEETGTVSIARNGELMRYLRADDVKEILYNAFFKNTNNVKEGFFEKLLQWRGEKK